MNPKPPIAAAEKELSPASLGKRDLFVEVRKGQAAIVEVTCAGNGESRVRRLREQRFTRAERNEAERLKRQIVYGENGGSLDLKGLYSPGSDQSSATLNRLAATLECRAGAEAWDRRRYPR